MGQVNKISCIEQGWVKSTKFQSYTVLDANVHLWRGWTNHGELTILQGNSRGRDGTFGLDMTEHGKVLEYRIIRSNGGYYFPNPNASMSERHRRLTSNGWPSGYLGLQFKVVLLCEQRRSSPTRQQDDDEGGGEKDNDDMVIYEFRKLKLEAVRVHAINDGEIETIKHYPFCKDQGYHQHGVGLLHLMGELN